MSANLSLKYAHPMELVEIRVAFVQMFIIQLSYTGG